MKHCSNSKSSESAERAEVASDRVGALLGPGSDRFPCIAAWGKNRNQVSSFPTCVKKRSRKLTCLRVPDSDIIAAFLVEITRKNVLCYTETIHLRMKGMLVFFDHIGLNIASKSPVTRD